MAKEKFFIEKDMLEEAMDELNALLFDDEHAIDLDQKEPALAQAIVNASVLLDPKDKISKDTLKTIKVLKDSGIVPEDDDDDTSEKKEEEEPEDKKSGKTKKEEPEEEPEEDDASLDELFDKIDKAKTRKDLVVLLKGNVFFKDSLEDLLEETDFKTLQGQALDMIEEAMDAAKKEQKKPAKKEEAKKPAKKEKDEEEDDVDEPSEKTDKKEQKKPSAKAGKKPDFGKRGDESFPAMAVRFLKEGTPEKEILTAYTKAYKERKNVTDADFIKSRVAIYMKLAKDNSGKK